jgi:hypothetical protein
VLSRCGYGTGTRYEYWYEVRHFLKKLMYVSGRKLRYGYVAGTDTGTYLIPVLSLEYPCIIYLSLEWTRK